MRLQTSKVLVFDGPEQPREWQRFVAALCFMLFFVEFVLGGNRLWTEGLPGLPINLLQEKHSWIALTQVLLACCSYMAGRSLWYGRRLAGYWLGLNCLVLILLCSLRAVLMYFLAPKGGFWLTGMAALETHLEEVPFLFVLMSALWLNRWPAPLVRSGHARWVLLALAWTIGCLVISAQSPLSLEILSRLSFLENLRPTRWMWLTSKLPFALVALIVLTRPRWLRIAALSLATCEITLVGFWQSFGLPRMVDDAIALLYNSWTKCDEVLPSPFPLGICYFNHNTFRAFTDLVVQAGPWILIAIYARRYPMRVPPDDGSPFPRRYCGHCNYNLHGISISICPECGRHLQE